MAYACPGMHLRLKGGKRRRRAKGTFARRRLLPPVSRKCIPGQAYAKTHLRIDHIAENQINIHEYTQQAINQHRGGIMSDSPPCLVRVLSDHRRRTRGEGSPKGHCRQDALPPPPPSSADARPLLILPVRIFFVLLHSDFKEYYMQ